MHLPTDEKISVDLVIQQLQDLECNWWAVGEAANIQQDELHHVSTEYICGCLYSTYKSSVNFQLSDALCYTSVLLISRVMIGRHSGK